MPNEDGDDDNNNNNNNNTPTFSRLRFLLIERCSNERNACFGFCFTSVVILQSVGWACVFCLSLC